MSLLGLLELSSDLNVMCLPNGLCTVSWGEATSLNLTDVEPDVQYIVEIYQLTPCSASILNKLNITSRPFYEFVMPDFPYQLVITPRSNVEGARNGHSCSVGKLIIE